MKSIIFSLLLLTINHQTFYGSISRYQKQQKTALYQKTIRIKIDSSLSETSFSNQIAIGIKQRMMELKNNSNHMSFTISKNRSTNSFEHSHKSENIWHLDDQEQQQRPADEAILIEQFGKTLVKHQNDPAISDFLRTHWEVNLSIEVFVSYHFGCCTIS